MGESEVKSAALWLGQLVAAEIDYLGSVRGKVERLSTQLQTLAAFLNDSAPSSRQVETVRRVICEGRNIAYDCEDVIETYMLKVARHGYEEHEGCHLGSIMRYAFLLRNAVVAHGIGSTIDELNTRISDLRSMIASYVVPAMQIFAAGDGKNATRLPVNEPQRPVYVHVKEEYGRPVGFEKHLDVLVERLKDKSDQKVIVICGMGGVGKSTLAKELYSLHLDLTAGGNFTAIGWATTSQQFKQDQVLQTLLYSLVPENNHERRKKIDEKIKANKAHAALAELMEEVKCLVIIDNIWETGHWESLQPALPRVNRAGVNRAGSRIILTTRNQDIVSDLDHVHIHQVEPLDEESSWDLFERITFPDSKRTDQLGTSGGHQEGQPDKRAKAYNNQEAMTKNAQDQPGTSGGHQEGQPDKPAKAYNNQEAMTKNAQEFDVSDQPGTSRGNQERKLDKLGKADKNQEAETKNEQDSEKKTLGEEMLRHCSGVPLAIVVLGKILNRKKRVEEWSQLRNGILAQIQRGSPATVAYGKVYDVLQVSYDELPSHLKNCFLHLANFPEDYEISTEKLYQLWVGEGIVVKEDTDYEPEEDIAERYLNQLVNRNMVQVASSNETGGIKTCRLHDLMREVCIDIARREGFVQTIKCDRTMLLSNRVNADHLLSTQLPVRDKRLRRIAVFISDQSAQSSTSPDDTSTSANVSRAPNLRSLLLFPVDGWGEQRVEESPGKSKRDEEDSKRFIETIVEDYPLLRVFDCENFLMKGIFPKEVKRLIHLRYLGLANTLVSDLPSSIEKLQWLQTLDLRVRFDGELVLSLPNVLWKMKQLIHIYLPHYGELLLSDKDTIRAVPQRYSIKGGGGMLLLDGLWNLQTILYLDLDRVDLRGVSKLKKLRWLSAVCENNNNNALRAFLECSSLKSFTLQLHTRILKEDPMILSRCEAIDVLDLYAEPYGNFHFTRPFCLNMLPKTLVSLGVWYHQFREDPFPVLERLPNLHYLGLAMCYGGSEMACSASGFPELTEMCLDGLFHLCKWEVKEGALKKLKSLLIINCKEMQIPEGVEGVLPGSVNVNIQVCGQE